MSRIGLRRLALATVVVVVAGCGSGGDPAADPTVASTAAVATVASVAPTTTPATAPPTPPLTTTTTTTTTTPPTTIEPTTPPTTEPVPTSPPPTTRPELPVPIAPPPDDGSTEPLVEIGTIEIPAIGLLRPLHEGIRLATLDYGPGHWPGSAMPGDVGNVVVAGHRVSHNQDFLELDELVPGDSVVLSTLAGRFEYKVISTEIVGPDAIRIVDQTYKKTATLFACHPPGSVRERIVVHLRLKAPART